MARPSKCTQKLSKEICRRLAEGESLRSICRDDNMPALSTVLLWVVTPEREFSDQYVQAREAAGYAHADSIIEVTEAVRNGDLGDRPAKVILDGLKWAAERMAPKAHSPKQDWTLSNPDGGPVNISVNFVNPEGNK